MWTDALCTDPLDLWTNPLPLWMSLWNQKNVAETSCAALPERRRNFSHAAPSGEAQKGPNNSYLFGPFVCLQVFLRHRPAGRLTPRHCDSAYLGVAARLGSVLYDVMHRVLPPALKAVWRPTVRGLEHVPGSGGVILASNHLSFVDSVVIPSVVPRKVVFLAKSDYFTGSGLRGMATRVWFEGLGMLPVDRDDTKAAIASLDIALDVLARGEAFGIYPEGTRSRDGRLYRGRTGVAHLALTAGSPSYPWADWHPERPAGRLQPAPRRPHHGRVR